MKKYPYIFIAFLFSMLFSCVPEKKNERNTPINIHAFSDAATLNPVSARDEQSHIVCKQLYQTLTSIDLESEELVGIIAKDRPTLSIDSTNQLIISYEIRPEAKFDDGSQITAKDVAFSLKLNVCPLINNVGGANYYGFIKEIVLTDNPLKISFKCEEIGPIYEYYSGDFAVLQQNLYDKNGILSQFSYQDLLLNESLEKNQELIEYANDFNGDKYAFDPKFISGSGAYTLVKWNKNQNILLEKKENWWGENIKNKNTFFTANATKLNYEVINDPTTALVALKSGKIDLMRKIPARDFQEIETRGYELNLNTESVTGFGYQYIGMNLNNEILADINVRKAIAYIVPKKKIIDKVFYGQGLATNTPIAASRAKLYSKNLNSYEFNAKESKALLESSNWKDDDKNGILEKEINGIITECKLTYHYNSGNAERKAVGLILKSEFKKLGIELEVIGLEWSTYLQKLRSNEMNIFYNAVSTMPTPPDFTSSFHSSSADGGRNYANYKNNTLDSLIGLIRITMEPSERIPLIKKFQEIVNNDLPYIFLFTPNERLAYNQDLKTLKIYALRPNFWPPELSWK